MDDSSEKPDDSHESSHKNVPRPLRYRTRVLWLLGFYILLILIPWVLTCVLAHRPINSGSYIRQQGFFDHDVSSMRKWKTAVDVLNSIAGLITSKLHPDEGLSATPANHANYHPVPVLSAVLAQSQFCLRFWLKQL
jgi:hypothetical protein